MGAMSTDPDTPDDLATLYRRAFEDFGASALWSSRPVPDPTPADALAITRTLRVEGDLRARRLAEQIEQACRRAPWIALISHRRPIVLAGRAAHRCRQPA